MIYCFLVLAYRIVTHGYSLPRLMVELTGSTTWFYHLYITECIASQYIIQSKEKDQLTLIPQFPNNIKPTNNSHRALINPYTKKPIP